MTTFPIVALVGCFAWLPSRGGGQIQPPAGHREVDPGDVAVIDGYTIEALATGLDLPTAVTFDDAGGIYVVEAGYSYGELFLTPRLVRIDKAGARVEVARGDNGPWTGAVWHDGAFYVAEGGVERGGRIIRVSVDGAITPLVEGLPSFGDHHTNGPVVGPDGYLYFGQGTATNAAVVGPDNYLFGWLARHPDFHDVPCHDVRLSGQNFRSKDPFTGGRAVTGPYLPFGTASTEGQVVPGALRCNGAVLRVKSDGTDLGLVASGFRNPFGLAFDPAGALYVTDNGYDDRGSRPVFGASDWLWRVETGRWYGWPDYADGERLGASRWKPPGAPRPRPVVTVAGIRGEPPEPAAIFGVHASADGFDFSRSAAFGYPGQAFVALFGDQASGVGKVEAPVGFKVVRVEPDTGVVHEFAVNRADAKGPASAVGSRGLERPLAVRFDPSGESLYIVDFGVLTMDGAQAGPQPGTGALWKVTRSAASLVDAGEALSAVEAEGRQEFMEHCHGCHPGGESGLGPPLTSSPASVWMQRQQVRLGAGKMPAFGRAELSRDELDALCEYLRALKHHRPAAD